ncbi:MAG: LysR family transcriptional regulator [Pseudomonadota bacterium]
MTNLNWVQSFVQVAEARSFVAAARLLGISASAVGKNVARLEERLRVRLFHRSTRSVTLTPEGAVFLERCRRVLGELDLAEVELQQSAATPRGKLRLSLPLTSVVTPQLLSHFHQRYPQVELEVDYSDRLVDVIEEGFDVVLRTGQPRDSRLMARVLGSCRRMIVGAPVYFERHGVPTTPQDLERHTVLLYRYPSSGKIQPWPLPDGTAMAAVKLKAAVVSNMSPSLLAMACEGLGIACLLDYEVRDNLRNGTLRSILDHPSPPAVTYHILWPPSRQLSPKVRAFVDFMMAETSFP